MSITSEINRITGIVSEQKALIEQITAVLETKVGDVAKNVQISAEMNNIEEQ